MCEQPKQRTQRGEQLRFFVAPVHHDGDQFIDVREREAVHLRLVQFVEVYQDFDGYDASGHLGQGSGHCAEHHVEMLGEMSAQIQADLLASSGRVFCNLTINYYRLGN